MRISELAEATGVPLPTVKYYLREGVLMPGAATGRTRATYDGRHVRRLRLIRALVESGGLGIAEVRGVVAALEDPPDTAHQLLRSAHAAIPPPVPPAGPDREDLADEVGTLLDGLGWNGSRDRPLVRSLVRAVADARGAGMSLELDRLREYAEAAEGIARIDVRAARETTSAEEALRMVVVGTVLLDPIVAILRRLAQAEVSERGADG